MRCHLISTVLVFFAIVTTAAAQEDTDVFRLFCRYGFGKGTINDPPENTPLRLEDVEALICTTNDWLTVSLRNYTKNPKAMVRSEQIDWGFNDWIYNGTEPMAPRNVPVIVNFTAVAYTTDGSQLHSRYPNTNAGTNQLLWEATKYFDYLDYIVYWVRAMQKPNCFTEARGMWYTPLIIPPVTDAALSQPSQCPAKGTPSTMAPVSVPTERKSPTFVLPPFSADVTPAPVSATIAPTTAAEEMVYYTIQIQFNTGKGREPTRDEVNNMMCQVDKFFTEQLRISPYVENAAAVSSFSEYIDYQWDPSPTAVLPFEARFFSNTTYPDGSHVPAQAVWKTFDSGVQQLNVINAIRSAEVYMTNIFYESRDVFFEGKTSQSMIKPNPTVGKIFRASCSTRRKLELNDVFNDVGRKRGIQADLMSR